MDEESASKFINALIKSVQTLCHGYVDFNNGVEIIGYINLSVDKGSSFDYVLKEKVCKNEENSTLFISNSFHAQPKPDKPVKAKNGQVETHISQRRHSVDTSESNQLSSAISSISTVLSGSHSQEKSRSIFSAKDSPASSSSSSSHHIQSTAKRKGEDDVNHDHPPKAANLSHESSSQHFFHPESSPHVSATSSPVDSKPSMSDVAGNVGESSRRTSTVTSEEMQPHIAGTMLPQTATVTSDANSDLGVNLASSVLERIDDQSNSEMQEKDDSDLDLEVTFIKEEYVEGERSACEFQNSGGGQYGRGPDQRASTSSDSMADTPLYPVALHTSAAAATFAPGSHEMAAMAQHYSGIPSSSLGIGAGPSTSHQPGPSGMRAAAEKFALARGRHHGACMEFVNYKILESKDPIPEGYQLLVEGSKLAVPVSWLHSVLSQCVGRGSSFILTMLANGLLRPWEVVHGGTSAYTGTYLEHVVNALKMYGVSHLNLTKSQATRVLNVKLCTGRRAQKKQFERSLEQKLINHPSRNPLK